MQVRRAGEVWFRWHGACYARAVRSPQSAGKPCAKRKKPAVRPASEGRGGEREALAISAERAERDECLASRVEVDQRVGLPWQGLLFVGPSADEVDPQALNLECRVNGEMRQNARTSDLIFDIPSLIETLSAGIALKPGDIIATGTPAGVRSEEHTSEL